MKSYVLTTEAKRSVKLYLYFIFTLTLNLWNLQRIAVWTMECVGYDEMFQREIREKYQNSIV
jgi:hypothetical protein